MRSAGSRCAADGVSGLRRYSRDIIPSRTEYPRRYLNRIGRMRVTPRAGAPVLGVYVHIATS